MPALLAMLICTKLPEVLKPMKLCSVDDLVKEGTQFNRSMNCITDKLYSAINHLYRLNE